MTGIGDALRRAGLGAHAAEKKTVLFDKAARALRDLRGDPAQGPAACYVPGRLEFVGKHTDYAGGRSLVCAIERGICFVATPRRDAAVRVVDADRGSIVTAGLDAEPRSAPGDWSAFVATVVRRLARDFSARTGADVACASDLPRASGMSSSSALVTGIFLVLSHANGLAATQRYRDAIRGREDLASYLAAVESGAAFGPFTGDPGVGTHGGSEDHVAMLCSRAGRLRQYAFCPVRFERDVPLPDRWRFVIAASGVAADKTAGARAAYNHAADAARAIAALWPRSPGESSVPLGTILASNPDAAAALRDAVQRSTAGPYAAPLLLDRLAQFEEESVRLVPAAAAALEQADASSLGAAIDRSQHLAETLLGNQVPETVALARSARRLGAFAASAFGAGFGGAVWALVEADDAARFEHAWAGEYHQRFPGRAAGSEFFSSGAGPGVVSLM